jgi:hypothetical protein
LSRTHASPRYRAGRLTAALAAVGLVLGLGAPASAADGITIGASGDLAKVNKQVDGLALHRYGKLAGKAITNAEFVNIESTMQWSTIANGRHDADIKRWAKALKGKGTVLVSFSHEPMSKNNKHMGTAASFKAAFKRMVNVFDAQGATNVQWVWNVTSHSFRVPKSRAEYGEKWYPGDNVIDFVSGSSYNKYKCGSAKPVTFESRIKDIFAFAKSRKKKFVVAEFGSSSYSGRADWIKDATRFMSNNRAHFRGAFYWNQGYGSCNYKLTSSAEFAALRSMANTL